MDESIYALNAECDAMQNEIARLESENTKLHNDVERMFNANVEKNGEIARLLDENAKLRGVIDDITEVIEVSDPALVEFIANKMERLELERME